MHVERVFRSHKIVMAGLVPAIPMMKAPRPVNRDRRDKPGDDMHEWFDLIGTRTYASRNAG